MDNDNDTDIGDRLRAAAWTPRARPDVTAIRRLAQRKVLAHRALGTAAGLVAVAGVIGALVVTADSNDDSTKVAAVDSSTTTEGTSTTEGTTTTTAEPTPTTETAAPTTTDPPPTTQAPQSYDFVVDLPIDTYDEERPLVAYVRDVMLHSDPAREGGCVWATDLETGETYSISWPDGYTARFVAVDGVEQPTEIRDASETGLARTGEPVRLTSGVGGQPSKCYVGGEVLASPWEVEPLG
jgi:hypothetical protein